MLTNRLLSRTARPTSQGGFTLVELLVVIGIIAILAGVALGPITNGIKKAKQSAGMQTVRSIALAEFTFSNDNNGSYPDTGIPAGNTGSDATVVAKALLSGNYINDASIFYLSGGTSTKYTGSTPASTIAVNNISWDFAGNNGSGVNANFPDQFPVAWSSVTGGSEPNINATVGTAIIATPAATNPFGTDGMAVAYKSNSSKFITTNAFSGSSVVTIVDTSYPGGAPNAKVLPGGG